MRTLDPRLLRQARAARRFLAAASALGVVGAVLVVAQAALLAYADQPLCVAGAGRDGLGAALAASRGGVRPGPRSAGPRRWPRIGLRRR